MDQRKKGEIIGGCVGSLFVYVILGIILYFGYDYDILKYTKIISVGNINHSNGRRPSCCFSLAIIIFKIQILNASSWSDFGWLQ